MRLLLVRHAEAAAGEPDELRPLTRRGRTQAEELARRLHDEEQAPDTVLTSPLLRARQTAAAIAGQFGLAAEPDDRLAPGATARTVLAAAAGRGECVLVVGHQPDCGRIAVELTRGPEPRFPPAALATIDVPDSHPR